MPPYLSPLQGFTESVNFLKYRLDVLSNKMLNDPSRLRVDQAFLIPYRNRARVDVTASTLVTPLWGDEAIAQVIHGLTTYNIEQGKQTPRETLRVPGVVALPPDWIKELQFLNSLRDEIELLVTQIEDRRQRLDAWKPWRLMSGLQVLRRTWIVDGPKKVTFFWNAAPSVLNKSAEDWIEHYSKSLIKAHGYVPDLAELDEGDPARQEVNLINVLLKCEPKDRFAAFRFGQPHIRARVTFHDSTKRTQRPAPTPIVYAYRDQVPTIIPLSNWEPDVSALKGETQEREARDKKTRSQTIDTEPLAYVHGYRFYRYLGNKRRGP